MFILGPIHYRRPPPAADARTRRPATRALRLGALAVASIASARSATAQELRYSITPTAERLHFDDALGLDNTFFYGGRAGVLFGRMVGLEGFYLTSRGTDARVRDLYARLNLSGTPPQNAGIDLSTYGANLVLNFGNGLVTPFVRGGGSIVRFSPAGLPATDRIALQYAGGLRVGKPGGIRLSAYAEDVRLRVDRTLLLAIPAQAGGAAPFDGDAAKLRSNLAYGAGLTIPLGGALGGYDDRPSSSLKNLSLPLEVFGGVVDWNGATGLKAQNIAGVRTGLDFGPLVGVRAYYWRGVNADFAHRDGVQSWGAEAQFNLNSGSGLTPFLLGGAGQVDFTAAGVRAAGSATDDTLRLRPADRTALIVGGGVKLPLTSFVSLTASARDFVTTRDSSRLQDANATGQLRSNWQYTAGLSIHLGRRLTAPRASAPPVAARERPDTIYLDRTGARVAARADSLRADTIRLRDGRTVLITARGDTLRGAAADSALGRYASAVAPSVRTAGSASDTVRIAPRAGETSYATDRTVAVVVPREGEITVRYGPAGPVVTGTRSEADMREDIRAAVRTAVREELGSDDPRGRVAIQAPAPAEVSPRAGSTRYGPRAAPAAMTREDVRAEIRAAIREELAGSSAASGSPRVPVRKGTSMSTPSSTAPATQSTPAAGVTTTTDVDRERRLLDSVDARVSARLAEDALAEDARAERTEAAARERAATERRSANGDVTRDTRPASQPSARTRRGFGGTTLYSGSTFSGGVQGLFGARYDVGALSSKLPGFRLVPELAFGAGSGGTTTLVAANATYEVGGVRLGVLGDVRPHAGLGVGLLHYSAAIGGRSGTDAVLNPAYGLTFDPAPARPLLRALSVGGNTPALLVEHQGVRLFDVNRLVLGITWRR